MTKDSLWEIFLDASVTQASIVQVYTALCYLRPDKNMAILEISTASEDMNVVISGGITARPKFSFHETAITFLISLCLPNATSMLCK